MLRALFDIKVVGGKMTHQHDLITPIHFYPGCEPHLFYEGSCYNVENHFIFDAGIAKNTFNKNIISVIYKPRSFMLSSFLFINKKTKDAYQTILCVDTDNKMHVKKSTLYRGWKSGLLRDGGVFIICIMGAFLGLFGVVHTHYSTPVNAILACTTIFLALLGMEYFTKFMLFASASKMLKRYFINNGLYRGKNIMIDMPLQIQSTNYDNPYNIGRIDLFKANEILPATKKNFILNQ